MKKPAVLATALTTALAALSAFAAGEVVKRGAPLSADAKVVTVAQLIESPDAYTKDTVVVEGVVTANCEKMGCWMQLAPAAGAAGVRVTFKDYGFFVPKTSKGMKARAEGVAEVKTLTKEEADHLEQEGAKLSRNADGTAREVSFVASGVELTRSSE